MDESKVVIINPIEDFSSQEAFKESLTNSVDTIVFDLVDQCNLVCPSCYHGINGGTKKKMSLETCRMILDHCHQYFQPKSIHPFNWSEPFMCAELDKFIRLFSMYPMKLRFSSNMNISLPESLIELLLQHTDELIFSVSGLDQEVYKKYHRGGKISNVMSNIKKFIEIRNRTKSSCQFIWSFGLNKHNATQADRIKEYCEANQINFALNRYYVTDAEDAYRILSGDEVKPEIYNIFYEGNNSAAEIKSDISRALTPNKCALLSRDIVLDCDGNLMVCCATKLMIPISITEIKSIQSLIGERLGNTFCNKCYKKGIAGYFFSEN